MWSMVTYITKRTVDWIRIRDKHDEATSFLYLLDMSERTQSSATLLFPWAIILQYLFKFYLYLSTTILQVDNLISWPILSIIPKIFHYCDLCRNLNILRNAESGRNVKPAWKQWSFKLFGSYVPGFTIKSYYRFRKQLLLAVRRDLYCKGCHLLNIAIALPFLP